MVQNVTIVRRACPHSDGAPWCRYVTLRGPARDACVLPRVPASGRVGEQARCVLWHRQRRAHNQRWFTCVCVRRCACVGVGSGVLGSGFAGQLIVWIGSKRLHLGVFSECGLLGLSWGHAAVAARP